MFSFGTVRATWFIIVAAMVGIVGGGCQLMPERPTGEVAIGALPELVMAMQQDPPKADFSSTILNPPRSTFKFAGKSVKLVTQIETKEPISFTIIEDYPGDPGSDGKHANYTVVFGPDPSHAGIPARGELHQSNPYFLVQSGWAYFAGSGAMGETGRVRTSPDSTEYFIQIDQSDPNVEIHRIINVSSNLEDKVHIVCPATDDGKRIHTVNRCEFAEFAADDDCTNFTHGPISANAAVGKFLESVGAGDVCSE